MSIIQTKSVADQVEEILRERIRDATYLPGSRMPSESELSDEMGVSRATVRTVLAKLAVNGLIIRKQGDGTYVNARAQEASAHTGNLWDLVRLIENNGSKPFIQPISITRKPASEKEAQALAVEAGEPLLLFKRLFLADQIPVIYSNNLVPLSFFRVSTDEIDGQLHFRDILRQYCHQEIGFVITDIRSTLVNDELRHLLRSELGPTVLELQMTFYSRNSQPLALGLNYFDDTALRLGLVQAWN
ncbi:MAG TPA: GntR family transcriptional regulator [Anaerolineales bacterium]|nr:GntR family transcriptional regulator [Anaerolineales bacterium]HNH05648.1 GntR family transcriptional regulator [Anaerolineales bacterium]HNJ11933.1 GntR family transcriptional regulator [Anaerolineales bacterium]